LSENKGTVVMPTNHKEEKEFDIKSIESNNTFKKSKAPVIENKIPLPPNNKPSLFTNSNNKVVYSNKSNSQNVTAKSKNDSKNNLPVLKQSIETVQTAKFNEIEIVDEFDH
jgi:hypothetical protein